MSKIKAIDAIRILSGIFEKDTAVDRLALVNLIVRGIVGDADKSFVKETVLKTTKLEIEF